MTTLQNRLISGTPWWGNLKHIPFYFSQPWRMGRGYRRDNLKPDIMAGLTVAVILLPQAIAFALIVELPPQMGLYAAIIGAIIGALWGSSHQTHTGPTNAISLLVLSSLLAIATPGTPEFILAAGMMAVMVGLFQLAMGVARLGMLVNFVSHSVVVGFSTGAGMLIAFNQLRHLLGLDFSSHNLLETLNEVFAHLAQTHGPTALLGVGTMIFIAALKQFFPKLPAALLSMVAASTIVFLLGLDKLGVAVIGQLPSSLPPLADLPLLDLDFIAELSTGALAVGAIGLVETTAIARSISTQTGQRLDSNQEFVGQGLANIASGLFSGYAGAGSFSRSAVNFKAGAQTPVSAIFSSVFVLIAMFTLAPLAAYLPRAALAGVLIVTAYGMIDQAEIIRIWRGTRSDAFIMLVTFLGTLFLHMEFAVLLGIMFSFAFYILKTSVPQVYTVVPDAKYKHFVRSTPQDADCPQLGIIKISGDLYFGAVSHVEEEINRHLIEHPGQRFLLLRMHGVNHCDFSGIHMLEAIRHSCQERGGDIFLMKIQKPVHAVMEATGFCAQLGQYNILTDEEAITYLFHKTLDPAICIYECSVRVFAECQNLPKRTYPLEIPPYTDIALDTLSSITALELWHKIQRKDTGPKVVDVREPREFRQKHIPNSVLIPLSRILSNNINLDQSQEITLVCRSGRRSTRAAWILQQQGYQHVQILQGGLIAWESANLLEAV